MELVKAEMKAFYRELILSIGRPTPRGLLPHWNRDWKEAQKGESLRYRDGR